jgi:hypothetical protein
MVATAKIIVPSTSPENVAAAYVVTPAEQALARLRATGKLGRWFHARHGLDADGWTCCVTGMQAALAPAVSPAIAQTPPTIFSSGGPGSKSIPYGLGKSSDPAGIMLTPAGTQVISWASDFTIAAVARAGATAGSSSTLCGIVGDNGGALAIQTRSSSLVAALTFVGSTPTHRWSTSGFTVTGNLWHNFEIVWVGNASAGVLSLYADGTLIGSSASFTPPTQLTTRLAILGAFDLQLDLDREGRVVSVAHIATFPVAFSADTATRDVWRAMVLDQAGSLPA